MGQQAQSEHDTFCEVTRERGVEALEVEHLLAEALERPGVRDGQRLDPLRSEVGITAGQRARDWATTPDPGAGGGSLDRRDDEG